MTQEQFTHFWDQLKAPLKQTWERFTEADLAYIQGSLSRFGEVLQKRYGELKKEEVCLWADRRHAHWSGNYLGYTEFQTAP
jgi:hypothetical protein